MPNTIMEEFEARSWISQNGNWACNWNLLKMESFDPQTYIVIQASNEFLPNMKVEDLVLPFPKSPRTLNSHVWLASYDRIDFRKSWTSKGHISQTIWPILVGFFPTSHIWSPLSKNINFMSPNFTNQNGIFWPISLKCKFDQCLTFWYKHFFNIWPIGTAQKCHLKHVCKLNYAVHEAIL